MLPLPTSWWQLNTPAVALLPTSVSPSSLPSSRVEMTSLLCGIWRLFSSTSAPAYLCFHASTLSKRTNLPSLKIFFKEKKNLLSVLLSHPLAPSPQYFLSPLFPFCQDVLVTPSGKQKLQQANPRPLVGPASPFVLYNTFLMLFSLKLPPGSPRLYLLTGEFSHCDLILFHVLSAKSPVLWCLPLLSATFYLASSWTLGCHSH